MAAIDHSNENVTEEEYESDEKEMSFLDHLEELRWRLVKAVLGILVAVIICGLFSDWIVNQVVLRPGQLTNPPLKLINTIPYGQITFYMMIVIVSGLILSSPWILYQVWKFIQPGLKPNEQKYISSIVVFTTLCFLGGCAFAYFVMLPYMLQFFATFGTNHVENMIAVNEYMSFVLELVLISGLIFELPMVSFFLARFGLLTPAFMRQYRKHSIVVILFIAAVVTPTTDPFTMAIFAFPMLVLYEISIFVAAIAKRKREESRQTS